ncbi:hypothetical protein KKF61_08185 [Patescibacteria group bacterium]|nr:hypothetical protein [Patescibacteria group bacterium]
MDVSFKRRIDDLLRDTIAEDNVTLNKLKKLNRESFPEFTYISEDIQNDIELQKAIKNMPECK